LTSAQVLRQELVDLAKGAAPAVVLAALSEAKKAAAVERDAAAAKLHAAEASVRLCGTLAAEMQAALPSATPTIAPPNDAASPPTVIKIDDEDEKATVTASGELAADRIPQELDAPKLAADARSSKRRACAATTPVALSRKKRRVSACEDESEESEAEESEESEAEESGDNADPNNDWCSTCETGGDLICCDGYSPHVPRLASAAQDVSFELTLCRCEHAYHGDCLEPKVDPTSLDESAPWFCAKCEVARATTGG
jgi:hypothetical protein